MVRKTDVYADTSAFIAFLDRSDSHHPLFRRLFSGPPSIITSSLVIAEGHAWFLRRYDRNRAVQFTNFLDSFPFLTTLTFGEDKLIKVGNVIRRLGDQSLTMADAHGLVIMTERRITNCWSTDRHLGLTGAALIS